ncbi:MAG: hypothetical protein R3A47_08520 [Polyangiales bacterium]
MPSRELDTARAFMEFLKERRPMPRLKAKGSDPAIVAPSRNDDKAAAG